MSPELRALFLVVAVALFVWGIFRERLGVVSGGLAAAFFPAMWDAIEAATE